jgi:hypothetical protein
MCADPTVLKALARAHRYQRMLDDGRFGSIGEMAAAEGSTAATSAACCN